MTGDEDDAMAAANVSCEVSDVPTTGDKTNCTCPNDLTGGRLISTPKRKSPRNNSPGAICMTWNSIETCSGADATAQPCTPPSCRLPKSSSWVTLQCASNSGANSSTSIRNSSEASSSGISRISQQSSSENTATTPKWFLGSSRVQQLKEAESTKRDSVLDFDLKGMHLSRYLNVADGGSEGSSAVVTASSLSVNCAASPIRLHVQECSSVAAKISAKGTTSHRSRNPFEHDLLETMHLSSFSPSVFSKVVTPSKDEFGLGKFCWGIENAALLYPKEFDEEEQECVSPHVDPDREEKIQKAINVFFTSKNCVPSPWLLNNSKQMEFSPNLASTVRNADQRFSDSLVSLTKCNASTQTTLTLPMDFDLETVLAGYFTHTADQNQREAVETECDARESLSTSTLRRKLFVSDELKEESSRLLSISPAPELSVEANSSMRTPQKTNKMLLEENLTPPFLQFLSPDIARTVRAQCVSLSPPMVVLSPTVSPIKTRDDLNLETNECTQDNDCINDLNSETNECTQDNDCISMMSVSCSQPNTPHHKRTSSRDTSQNLYLPTTNEDNGQQIHCGINPTVDSGPSWLESLTGMMPSTISYMDTSSSNAGHGTTSGSSSDVNTNPSQDTGYNTLPSGIWQSSTSAGMELTAPHNGTTVQPSSACTHQHHPTAVAEDMVLPAQTNFNLLLPTRNSVWSPLVASTPSRSSVIYKESSS